LELAECGTNKKHIAPCHSMLDMASCGLTIKSIKNSSGVFVETLEECQINNDSFVLKNELHLWVRKMARHSVGYSEKSWLESKGKTNGGIGWM